MQSDSSTRAALNGPCLVLMLKSPARSKRRLSTEIGAIATQIAEHLCDCALEDMRHWPGPKCFAPAARSDRAWLGAQGTDAALLLEQSTGNLGDRIADINRRLLAAGHARQIFIGIDCPALDHGYLTSAALALTQADVVLGPAADGGVVLLGVDGAWPDLGPLPWSTPALMDGLVGACAAAGKKVELLATLRDVDSTRDLLALREHLAGDTRPARRALAGKLIEIASGGTI